MQTDENPIIQEPVAEPGSGLTRAEGLAKLRERLMNSGFPTVKQEYGTPQRGLEAGQDEVFVIDRATYEALIKSDPKSEAILKPFVRGDKMDRWFTEPYETWLIHTMPGAVDIDDYPAVRDYLSRFRGKLEKRTGGRQWFELEGGEHLDPKDVSDLKIVYHDNVNWPGSFALDRSGAYHSGGYHLRNGDNYIAGLLNSKVYWFLLEALSPSTEAGVLRVEPEHIEVLPVPRMVDLYLFGMVGASAELCHKTVAERRAFYDHVQSEIVAHLAPGKSVDELSAELRNWHMLTIDTLQAEVKRLFGKDLAEDEANMWEHFLNEAKHEFGRINSDIARGERQIDLAICHMFNMTPDEIEFLIGSF